MSKLLAGIIFFVIVFISETSGIAKVNHPTKNTEIIIIGTVHDNTANFNSDTLLNIFKNIKPDVILVECDTSYMTKNYKLNEDIEYMFPETAAITDYSKVRSVTLRPYDINGRDVLLDDNERKIKEANFFNDISILQESGKLSPEAEDIYSKIQSMITLAGEMSYSGASFINSEEGSSKIDTINYYTYTGLKMLIEETSGLSEYRSYWKEEIKFWNDRNNVMLKNILKYSKQFKGKRIVVLCGFAHKNFLKRSLSQKAPELTVKEFYDL